MKLVSGYESIQKALPFGEGWERLSFVNEEKQPGVYEIEFNPENCIKHPASGVYFYKLIAGEFTQTRKMILLR